jgi:hypothetical protein
MTRVILLGLMRMFCVTVLRPVGEHAQYKEMQDFYSRISNADKELANSTTTSSSPTLSYLT